MSGIALKLTSLMVRTVAKPIATALKAQAKEHEVFRKSCIRIAQTVHSTDLRLRMSLLGENRIKIRPLNDKKAIENGANFLSEMFIFGVAGSLILYESYRSRKATSNHREAVYEDMAVLQDEIEFLKRKLKELNIKTDDYELPEGWGTKFISIPGVTDTPEEQLEGLPLEKDNRETVHKNDNKEINKSDKIDKEINKSSKIDKEITNKIDNTDNKINKVEANLTDLEKKDQDKPQIDSSGPVVA